MPFQEFDTADVVRLEIERDPVGAERLNLVPNPDASGGEGSTSIYRRIGGWGWVTPVYGSGVAFDVISGAPWLRMSLASGGLGEPTYFETEKMLLKPTNSSYVTATYEQQTTSGVYTCGQLLFYDANRTLISTGNRGPATTTGMGSTPVTLLPVGVVYVVLRIWAGVGPEQDMAPTLGYTTYVRDVTVVGTSTTPSLSNVARTNLCPNSSAILNVTGWTASGGTLARNGSAPWDNIGRFQLTKTAATATLERGGIAVTVGLPYSASAYVIQGTTSGTGRMFIRWRNSGGTQVGSTVFGSTVNLGPFYERAFLSGAVAPAGAATADVGIQFQVGTGTVFADAFLFEQASSVSSYIPDGTPTLNPTVEFPATPNIYWQDVTDDLQTVTTNRVGGDVGTLSADLVNAALDPATGNTLLRPGRQVRLSGYAYRAGYGYNWEPIFRGRLQGAKTAYELLNESSKEARITISAVDAWAVLAAAKITGGVGTIQYLPSKLEGLGVPWFCNANTNQSLYYADNYVADTTVLDNVLVARDEVNGYAWINRFGVLCAFSRSSWATYDPSPVTLDEDVYNGSLSASFDSSDLINSVSVKVLDDATEADYGPYEDGQSIVTWGRRTATFTVAPWGAFNPATYAAGVLAGNAQPGVSIDSMTIPLHTQARINSWATLDLYQLATVENSELGYSEDLRILSVSHTITQGRKRTDGKWLMTLTFVPDNRAPIPTVGG